MFRQKEGLRPHALAKVMEDVPVGFSEWRQMCRRTAETAAEDLAHASSGEQTLFLVAVENHRPFSRNVSISTEGSVDLAGGGDREGDVGWRSQVSGRCHSLGDTEEGQGARQSQRDRGGMCHALFGKKTWAVLTMW